ncbi:DUF418 domain-containing protein [Marinicauda pacifica]|jgi:uncharacterized protein|uniref:DUF418 domain-containing protein n=1 Tax=Marinicauda pacifica TaxID=1133559 RepID=UPI0035C8563E
MSTTLMPVRASDRFESIDMLRGIAVLGILMVNIQVFAMYWGALEYPPAHMDMSGANGRVWWITQVFFELKFITLFSALFGAGIVLMVGEDAQAPTALHRRRMLWLLAIGLVHGFVLWFGDILVPYALAGFVVVLARRWSPTRLVVWGLVAIAFSGLLMVGAVWAEGSMPGAGEPAKLAAHPTQEWLERWVGAYQSGFLQSRAYNAAGEGFALIGQITLFAGRLLGVMWIGMALYKTGFLTAQWRASVYAAIGVIAVGAGVSAEWVTANANLASGFAPEFQWVATAVNYGASLATAFGYASIVMLLAKPAVLHWVRLPFASAGRMAFTNYLTQTLVMTFLFVGPPGLGWFGTVERSGQAAIVLAVWVAQLAISTVWLKAFRFGPAEWAWRSLSYREAQPFLR